MITRVKLKASTADVSVSQGFHYTLYNACRLVFTSVKCGWFSTEMTKSGYNKYHVSSPKQVIYILHTQRICCSLPCELSETIAKGVGRRQKRNELRRWVYPLYTGSKVW